MPWVRIDEEFPQHPKVVQVGPLGVALQVAGLCYANKHLTDGFIPHGAVRVLLDFNRLGENIGEQVDYWSKIGAYNIAAKLVEAGIWRDVPGGFQIHDFEDYQPTKAQVLAERDRNSEAGKRSAAARSARRQQSAEQGANASFNGSSTLRQPVPVPVPGPHRGVSTSGGAVDPPKGGLTASEKNVGTQAADAAPAPQAVVIDLAKTAAERDAQRLCDRLADRIQAWSGERPNVGKRWLDAARLLITKDGYTPEQVTCLIDWATDSDFWRPNILSMPKLRSKRLTLIGQIQRDHPRRTAFDYIREQLAAEGEPS